MTNAEMDQALRDGGFVWNTGLGRWVGYNRQIRLEHIRGPALFELDQVVAGAKRGETSISLGPDKVFEFK